MNLEKTIINDLFIITPSIFKDKRGVFFKTFHEDSFKELGLNISWKEEYFSISNKNVVRGMHFQTPPHDHFKLVTCLKGAVLDVVLDLRRDSSTYGKNFSIELSCGNFKQLLIPNGCAHGFLSLKDNSLMFYKVSTAYAPINDSGILWNSFGFEWPIDNPLLSERDQSHSKLKDFKNPF